MLKVHFRPTSDQREGALVLVCFENQELSHEAQAFEGIYPGLLKKALKTHHFQGKRKELLALTAPTDTPYSRVFLLGLGKPENISCASLQDAGGALAAALRGTPDEHVEIRLGTLSSGKYVAEETAAHMAFGAQVRHWRFDKYRTKEAPEKKPALHTLSFVVSGAAHAQNLYEPLEHLAQGVCLTRELITEPPNVLYPASYGERLQELTKLGIKVEILGLKELEKLGMGALLGVAQGSVQEARVVVLHWMGASKDQKPLVVLGKGVTFDSGGISLKPSSGMSDMKYDMGGSAVVAGLLRALAGRKAKTNVVGVLGLVENMPSGTAQRPSDVVKSLSGQTIEVLDTDAEGRLVLADILWYAQERFKPQLMIDLATLTGAISVTFGDHYAGLFSNNDALSEQLTAVGNKVGERVWRLPLGEEYDREIDSEIADMKNLGSRGKAGSITAAQFLERFVNNVPWAHLDIASVTWSEKPLSLSEKGATGYGVRLLNQFIQDHYES